MVGFDIALILVGANGLVAKSLLMNVKKIVIENVKKDCKSM